MVTTAIGVSRLLTDVQGAQRIGLRVAAWSGPAAATWRISEQDQSGALLCSSTSRFLGSAGEATIKFVGDAESSPAFNHARVSRHARLDQHKLND